MKLRPVYLLILIISFIVIVDSGFALWLNQLNNSFTKQHSNIKTVVADLGLTDLCIATEARYTRHPAISDSVVPFMDYPGSFEHFPTGSFWASPFE